MTRFPLFVCSFLLCISGLVNAKPQTVIRIAPTLNGQGIELNKSTTEDITIETLKFYITNIKLLENNAVKWTEKESYHLIDLADSTTMNMLLTHGKKRKFDALEFDLGVDSLTNEKGVMGGDLDPLKGMYWTWQSGYINFKLEGTFGNQRFEYHIGGYAYLNNTIRRIRIPITNTEQVTLNLELGKLIRKLNKKEVYKVLSPGKKATIIADSLTYCFK